MIGPHDVNILLTHTGSSWSTTTVRITAIEVLDERRSINDNNRSKYLLKEWKSLAWLLGPIMTSMWIVSSLLIYALVPHLPYVCTLLPSCIETSA